MKKANTEELRVLDTFFRTVASSTGVYNRSTKLSNQSSPLFQLNLDILRTLIKKKVNLKALEDACRRGLNDGIQTTKINEVSPELEDTAQLESLDRNLINPKEHYIHRKLRLIEHPISEVFFGYQVIKEPDVPEINQASSFTMKELIQFFCEATNQHYTDTKAKTLIGSFNYLLSTNSLEDILFAIDHSSCNEDSKITNPLDLNKFTDIAREELLDRTGRA